MNEQEPIAKTKKGRPINSRDKGKRGERQAAEFLREQFGWSEARRALQYSGRGETADLVLPFGGLHVEVKYVQRWLIDTWMAQAVRDAGKNSIPLVMHRKNRIPWLMIWLRSDRERLMKLISKHTPSPNGVRVPQDLGYYCKYVEINKHIWSGALKDLIEGHRYGIATWLTAGGMLLDGAMARDMPWLCRARRDR